MKFINSLLTALPLLVALNVQAAADDLLKPFVLGSKGAGTVAEKTEQAKSALTSAGFSVVGNYSPYPDAQILIVTSDELKKNAAASEFGGYGAVQRVAITKAKNDVQVSYTNLAAWMPTVKIPVYGALLEGENVFTTKAPKQGLLVIGSEGKGIRENIIDFITHPVTIPKSGGAESLNAGIAAGIIVAQLTR